MDENIPRDLFEFSMALAKNDKITSISLSFPLYQVAAQLIANNEEYTLFLETLNDIQESVNQRDEMHKILGIARNRINLSNGFPQG